MKIYDITRSIMSAPAYPGDDAPVFNKIRDIDAGDICNCTVLTANLHSGTHADAFSHYIQGGTTIDRMPLEHYCGKCRVLTVPSDTLVKLSDIQGKLAGSERLVLRTGGTSFLCEQAAEYIAACGIKAVVTDAVSIAPDDNEQSIHNILFEGNVALIENAILDGIEDGDYLLFAFPAKFDGADGAPVRAVLVAGE